MAEHSIKMNVISNNSTFNDQENNSESNIRDNDNERRSVRSSINIDHQTNGPFYNYETLFNIIFPLILIGCPFNYCFILSDNSQIKRVANSLALKVI